MRLIKVQVYKKKRTGGNMVLDVCDMNEAAEMVERFHYARRMPSRPAIVRNYAWRRPGGLFGDAGPAAAVAVYALPANQHLRSKGGIELARVTREPGFQKPLSHFVAWTARRVAEDFRPAFVISFADTAAGHHGGLYQALGWYYLGLSRCYQTVLTSDFSGEELHGREVARRFGTQDRVRLREQLRGTQWRLGRAGDKHVYVKPMIKSLEEVCRDLRRREQPYPKPDVMEKLRSAC